MTTDPDIRAIVFDMDGVLINSASCHREAFDEVFREFGVRDFDYGRYAGWRTAEVVRDVLRPVVAGLSDELVEELGNRKSRLARERVLASNPSVPGCTAVLERLAKSYVLALASSGSRQSVELFLTANRCRGLFRSVLCGDQVQHAKPNPEIYERTFAALAIPARAGIVVEDAISGIEAARAAGAREVIGVAGTVPAEALRAAGAARVVNAITELPELLCESYEPARTD